MRVEAARVELCYGINDPGGDPPTRTSFPHVRIAAYSFRCLAGLFILSLYSLHVVHGFQLASIMLWMLVSRASFFSLGGGFHTFVIHIVETMNTRG